MPAAVKPAWDACLGLGCETESTGTGPAKSSRVFFSGGNDLSVQLERAQESRDEKINSWDRKRSGFKKWIIWKRKNKSKHQIK